MNRLTAFSMKNITAIFIIILLLAGGGTYATSTLKVESMPDISLPMVFVTTQYIAPPRDVMEDITEPLESAISGLEGLKNMTSTSSDNFSTITVELESGEDPEEAKRDIEGLISNVKLPSSAERPKVATFGFASQPVYYLAVYADNGMSQLELDKLYKDVILPGFESMKGIDHVDSIGNQETILNIKLDFNSINSYGLTPQQVSDSIKAALTSSPAGTVDFSGNTQMVRVKNDFNSIYNLEHLKISTPNGDTLLLNQVANVEPVVESEFLARLNAKPAIGVLLFKTKQANAVEFGTEADKLMAQWSQDYPNVKFHTIYNSAVDIQNSINGMLKEGVLGAILASIMILVFLKNVRMTAIVLVSIPLSILITLLVMAPLDISLNIMTLGGMTIAVGRVVDDSIVVIENIYSQLQRSKERNDEVIKVGTAQVASAITSSTITTVGVFAPIAMVSGILGEIFRPFAITLAVSLLSSLIVAVTVIPVLAKLLVLNSKNIKHHDEAPEGKLSNGYKRTLVWSLNNRKKTFLISILLFIVTVVGTVPFLPSSFMPESESDKLMYFTIKMPRETNMDTMNEKVKEIEEMMLGAKDESGNPVFDSLESLIGYNDSSDRVPYRSQFFAAASETADAKVVVEEFKDKILYLLPKGSEVNSSLLSGAGMASGVDFSYMLKGDDLDNLVRGAEVIREKMKEFPELKDIKDSLSEQKTEVEISVDQNNARIYGLSTTQIMGAVSGLLAEENIGDLKLDGEKFETKVMLDSDFKDSLDKIGSFLIKTPTGATVRLSDVAKVKQVDSPASITREMEEQYVSVTAKIDSPNKGGISAQVGAALRTVELPPGVRAEVKGVSDDIQESFSQMFVAMGAAVFIVYLIMVLAFGNGSAPFAILFSLPLAAIGGLIGLRVTGESLNVTSLIGFLMLIGIVVTNAIVLIDRVQQLREQGLSVREALVEGSMARLRPIIMTAGATIFALMPMALGLSKGALLSKGLAIVVIGGLTTSTILTLIVVPIVYEMIENFKNRVARLFKRKPKAPVDSNSAPAAN